MKLVLALLLALPVFANDWNQLRQTVKAELAEHKIPGAVVAVVANDKVVFAEAFGNVTTHGRFRIGSLTKMFTAAAIVSLAQDGKVALDVPVKTYVDGLPAPMGERTLDQLLKHRAGFVDRVDGTELKSEDVFLDSERIFSYSSIGYSLAGRAAAAANRSTFDALLAQRLFTPLQMLATSYAADPSRDVPGYRLKRGRAVPAQLLAHEILEPAGMLYSTSDDLARFAIAFMNGGLAPDVVAALSQPHAPIPGETRHYGYGTFIDGDTVYHGGDEPTGSAFLKMIPKQKTAVIVLTNLAGRLEKSMAVALHLPMPLPPPQSSPLTATDIAALIGEYDNAFGLRIQRKGSKALFGPPLPWYLGFLPFKRELVKLGPDRYAILVPKSVSADPIPFTVVRDDAGKVEYLFLRGRAFKRTR